MLYSLHEICRILWKKEDPVIDVAGGAVALDGSLETIDDTAPAGDPVFWADATQTDSLVIETEGGTNFISRWNDCRADRTLYYALADNANNKVGRKPYVSADTCNGLPVVDFGEFNVDSAYMTINCGAILEAFEVVRIPREGYLGPNIFGCSGQDLLRECTTSLISTWAAYLAPCAGLWTMDGLFVDPWQNFTVDTDHYYVASFSNEENAGANYLGTDRNILNNGIVECGDTRLGEFIAYNRRPTDEERRQTIDYLQDAAFHVDASQPETITYRAGQESDGRIDKWFDCRFNGRYAQTPTVPQVEEGRVRCGHNRQVYRFTRIVQRYVMSLLVVRPPPTPCSAISCALLSHVMRMKGGAANGGDFSACR